MLLIFLAELYLRGLLDFFSIANFVIIKVVIIEYFFLGAATLTNIFQGPNKVTRFISVSERGTKPWVFVPKSKQVS